MKRLTIFLCLTMFGVANADFLGVKQASETISFFIKEPIDSLYGIPRLPDSVHIMTYADNASAATFQTRSTTYPFSDVSIDTLKIYGDTVYVFADQIQDIDGAGGNFELAILVKMFTNGYYLETHHTVQVISDSLENMLDASKDSSSSAAVLSKNNLDSLQSQDGWVAKEATLAYFDTLIYVGPRGLGVYLDSAAGNANTVIGTDGTSKNPVSTIAAAKTIATALGYNRYYFINASTFNDAANDIPSSHQNWEFIGIGNSNALAFGTQRVDESRFENMDLSGAMHASGGDVLYTNCSFGYITANFNGHAFNCWLEDTIVVKADQDIDFARCQSGVAGNRTPTIDLSGGSSVVQLRGYSGGIRIMNGASTDTMSIETDGQLIISANNTSTNITVRGMLTLTDSGTTTNLTKDAVFSRAEADLWIWANADTTHPDSSELGVWLVNNLSGAASGLDTLSTAFVARLVDDIASYAFYATKGAVGGAPTTTGFSSAALTQTTTNHWKDNMFAMFTGPNIGEAGRITAFTPATDSITFTPAFAFAPTVGDSFFIFTLISESGSATGVDSTVLSNVLHRIAHGTPVGSGSDSSTSAQRDIGTINSGGISSGSFVAGALNSNAFGSASLTAVKFGTGFIQNTSFAARALSLAKFDSASLAAFYAFGIWLDDAAANTNTTVGVDGTPANPVSTLAAARILADSMGLMKYYITNNSSFTLDATYEDWCFTGRGESNEINFGSQDIDNSHFEHLMVAGTQGGTGLIWLNECYMDAADSLECVARNSWFSDTISVRVASNIVFDNCYSAVAGNNTPGLDFNSGGGTINVNIRHYSGGLALFNMTSNHTISYETDGQLVIDASCTSANVTARGNMTITDNGTTTSLTSNAVFNTTQNVGINWGDISNQTTLVDLTQTTIDSDQKVDLNTTEYHQIWSPTYSPFIIEKAAAVTDGSNTTLTFETSLPIATDDWYNGLQMIFRYDNGSDSIMVVNIVDYTGATKFVTIRPGLPTAPATDDSLWIIASRIAVEPSQSALSNYQLTLSGDKRADINLDGTEGQLDSNQLADDYWTAVQNAAGTVTLPDSVVARIDSILNSVGWDAHYGGPTYLTSLQEKIGDEWLISESNVYTWLDSILTEVRAAGAGTGEFACSLLVYDGSNYIAPAGVRMVSGAQEFRVRASADGWAVFSLDGGTWTAMVTALRFEQDTIPQTFTFSADYVDTLTMTAFSPSTPTDTGKVNLYVWTDRILGDILPGATFRVIPLDKGKNWVTGGGRILPLGEVTATTDSTGYAEIEVYQSSYTHPYPSGSDSLKYNISITYPGLSSWAQFRFVAPDSGNQYQIGVIE